MLDPPVLNPFPPRQIEIVFFIGTYIVVNPCFLLRSGLDFLNEKGRYSEAARLVEAMGYRSRLLKGVLRRSLTAMVDSGQVAEVRAYVERIPESHAKNLKTDAILRMARFKTDTEGFIRTLQEADVEEGPERKNWLLDPKALEKVFDGSSDLGESLILIMFIHPCC